MKLDSKTLQALLASFMKVFSRYAAVWFLLFLAGIYGFVLFQINAANSAQPYDSDVTTQEQAVAAPHIDPAIVEQVLTLQDHSVNVRTLFEQARKNPFSE